MKINTNYEELLPKKKILFNLKEIESMGILKISMAKKLLTHKEIEYVKIGNKIHITREELIRFLVENTIPSAS